ncbi:MAG: PilW family protein [Kangiellaceae bacterium]|nr:PilW family protein [Kangiellaceae bacterium]
MINSKQKIVISRSLTLSARKQSGFTIVELMIAGVLGIILTAGVIQLFVGSNRTYTLQDELANVQENGRFAMIFLENEIQKGGWIDDFSLQVPPAIDLNSSSDGVTDAIAVSYALPPASRDCNGAIVGDGIIINQFYVGGTSGDELLCQGNGGGAAQPLIDGVRDFQILYGVETNSVCPDGAVNQYMTRDQIVAAGGNLVIVSARVAVLLASENDVLPQAESHTHDLLDTQLVTNDKLAYRTFQQTIYMPNAYYATAGNPEIAVTCLADQVGS